MEFVFRKDNKNGYAATCKTQEITFDDHPTDGHSTMKPFSFDTVTEPGSVFELQLALLLDMLAG